MALKNNEIIYKAYEFLQKGRTELETVFGTVGAKNIMYTLSTNKNQTVVDSEGVSGTRPPECYPPKANAYKFFHCIIYPAPPNNRYTEPVKIFRLHVWYNQGGVVKVDYEKFLEENVYRNVT